MKIKICGLKAMPVCSFRETRPEMEIGPEGHMESPGSIWFRKELKRLARVKSNRQKDQDFKSDMYAQDTMKMRLPKKYENYPSHLADMEA